MIPPPAFLFLAVLLFGLGVLAFFVKKDLLTQFMAVEIMLKGCWDADQRNERPDQARWVAAVKACGYVQARLAVRKEMAPAAGRALELV